MQTYELDDHLISSGSFVHMYKLAYELDDQLISSGSFVHMYKLTYELDDQLISSDSFVYTITRSQTAVNGINDHQVTVIFTF